MPTPPDPEQPHPGPPLEPVRVLRPRRFDALAELMREMHPEPGPETRPGPDGRRPPGPRPDVPGPRSPAPSGHAAYESFGTAPGPGRAASEVPRSAEDETQELPPVPAAPRPVAPGAGRRRAAAALAVGAAALAGFGCALLLPARQGATAAPRPSHPVASAPASPAPASPAPASPAPASPAPASPAGTPSTDPDGPGTLRQGDTGPEVTELQQRLLGVPDVYRDGSTSGTYDAVLTEAVARFQLWYGITGDETGVYGDDTRRALESRTAAGTGG
ncbi:peptidoglycan-binding domain-containing protein [Streptomyces sp. NPDC005706]|uniref:peptidoglycan-binding domain-containing protein n=1 Tax=Streptomyces sp. NPDC005706 TaxID=3157169 RepID=UPI0033F8F17A